MPNAKGQAPRVPKREPRTDAPPRRWLSIPMTTAMLEAVKRASRGKGINQTNFCRLHILANTDYDAETDDELPKLIHER